MLSHSPAQAVLQQSNSPRISFGTSNPQKSQPLCGDPEGWGPLSPTRWDLTPCFLDTTIVAVALFGFVLGSGAVWYLSRRKPEHVPKNWHFYAKLSIICGVIVTCALQAALIIQYHPKIWHGDFRFWSVIALICSLGVILYTQYLEHRRSRVPNGVVLFYWLLFLIAHLVKLRSLISQQVQEDHLAFFVVFCITTGLAAVEFVLEWLVPKRQSSYEALGDENECPYNYANIFSVLTFTWMTPMMKYGYNRYLRQADLWRLRSRDSAATCVRQFDGMWQNELEGRSPKLWVAMFRAYGGPYARGTIFKSMSDILNFVQPQLLRLLISFVKTYRTPDRQPIARGVAIAIGMFACSVLQTCCLHQYFQRSFETGMRVKSGLTTAIYAKALRLSTEGRASLTTGDIVNRMSVDVQRLQDLCQFGQMLWSAPFQLVLCLASLYNLVGLSFLAGIAVMIAMIPVNGLIARMMKKFQERQMKTKDARTRLMTEILNNQKSIKLYAWGQAFMKRLRSIRNDQELKTLRQVGSLQAFANFTWSTTPFLVSCLTFAVFVLIEHKPLTVDVIFPALTLFNLLTFPLMVIPMVITSIVEAGVAVNRLQAFLQADEYQEDAVIVEPAAEKKGEETVQIVKAAFTWDRYQSKNVLDDLSFSAKKGELSCIVGRVGAGKSTFLEAILGNVYKSKGTVLIKGKVAYVAQTPWVMNASVKENILFGHKWDQDFYDKTVKACALLEDFSTLPDGDNTQVGERGISLSGGQKARLTLARAVYARADLYLLDDVLSAVDQHVGRHLIENVLGDSGLLKSRTRILATNSVPVLSEADWISFIHEGRIVESGTYDELNAHETGHFADLIRASNNDDRTEFDASKEETNSSGEETVSVEQHEDVSDEEIEELQEGNMTLMPIKTPREETNPMARQTSTATLRRASTASFRGPRGKLTDEEETGVKSKQTEEAMEQGKVKWDVYMEYARSNNLFAVSIYLAVLLGAQIVQVGGNVWLKEWAEANQKQSSNPEVGKYIGVYFGFGIGSAFLTVIQTLILWIFCSIEASRKLHDRMAVAIFRSPMTFFETTPVGRVLNRFSSDIYRVDEVLARTFNMLFVNSSRAILTLCLVSFATPAFISLIIPLALLYLYIQRYYLRTSRELKRLDSVSRSPIFAHFQETIVGVNTIRAFGQQERFQLDNEWRVDANIAAYFPSISANRWLAVRLEFIGSIVIFTSATFAIISITKGSDLSAGWVGLSMSYALQITQSLNWIVRQTVEVETNIVSVERVLEYSRLPSEAPEVNPKNRPPLSWPSQGVIKFDNFSTRYRPGLDLVLKNINLEIKPHEKIGVVGRTGAGKSSLTLALFRIIEPAGGHIEIDDVNTSKIGLLDLRRRLAIIPQDAALFEGTIRDNLDPGHVHDDTELWSVLESAALKSYVSTLPSQLDHPIHEAGSNLSAGQRQLISLARALLTPSHILVLDEATAAVDVQTDVTLQATLRGSQFKHKTIITIAHRINTILDSDRVLVLDKGEVAELGTPSELAHRRGLFWKLVKEAGLEGSLDSNADDAKRSSRHSSRPGSVAGLPAAAGKNKPGNGTPGGPNQRPGSGDFSGE